MRNAVNNKDKKVYVIINDKKEYIDPEIVEKYSLYKDNVSYFTGLELHSEED